MAETNPTDGWTVAQWAQYLDDEFPTRRSPTTVRLPQWAAEQQTGPDPADLNTSSGNLERWLSVLTDREQEAVERVVIAGRSMRAVARETDFSYSDLRRKLHSAFNKMKAAWPDMNPDNQTQETTP